MTLSSKNKKAQNDWSGVSKLAAREQGVCGLRSEDAGISGFSGIMKATRSHWKVYKGD